MSIQRFHVGPRLSEMAIHNNTIYLAGQVADDTSQDIGGQTKQVLTAIDKLLAEAGSDLLSAVSIHQHGEHLVLTRTEVLHRIAVRVAWVLGEHLADLKFGGHIDAAAGDQAESVTQLIG